MNLACNFSFFMIFAFLVGCSVVKNKPAEPKEGTFPSWEEVTYEIKKANSTSMHFERGSATLGPLSLPGIHNVIRWANRYPEHVYRIAGHADNCGTEEEDMRLSFQRARLVELKLLELGLPPERIVEVVWYGHKRMLLADPGHCELPMNDRVEVDLVF